MDVQGLDTAAYTGLGALAMLSAYGIRTWRQVSRTRTDVHGETKERSFLDRMEKQVQAATDERNAATARAMAAEAIHTASVARISALEATSLAQRREILHLRAHIESLHQWLQMLAERNPNIAGELLKVLEVPRWRTREDEL